MDQRKKTLDTRSFGYGRIGDPGTRNFRLKKRTVLGSHPLHKNYCIESFSWWYVRRSEVTQYQSPRGVRIPLIHQFFNRDEDRQQPKNAARYTIAMCKSVLQ